MDVVIRPPNDIRRSDPDPVRDFRIRIRPKRSGSATLQSTKLVVSLPSYTMDVVIRRISARTKLRKALGNAKNVLAAWLVDG
jgi:hypothetical protein